MPTSREAISASPQTDLRSQLTVRRYLIDDPISEITLLLHRAYAGQVAAGLRPLAGRQDDKTTLDRVLNSECYLATLPAEAIPPATLERMGSHTGRGDRVVGVILFNEHERVAFPSFFLEPGVAHFAMFGVEPAIQGAGIGAALLARCEERAAEIECHELALSMAEPDAPLRAYYNRRGYRFIEHWQWPYTNYKSCILSKQVAR